MNGCLLKVFGGSVVPGQSLKDEILNLVYPGNLRLFKTSTFLSVHTTRASRS